MTGIATEPRNCLHPCLRTLHKPKSTRTILRRWSPFPAHLFLVQVLSSEISRNLALPSLAREMSACYGAKRKNMGHCVLGVWARHVSGLAPRKHLKPKLGDGTRRSSQKTSRSTPAWWAPVSHAPQARRNSSVGLRVQGFCGPQVNCRPGLSGSFRTIATQLYI